MNSKEISPPVAIAIGAVVLVIILALGYKFFLAPAPSQGNTAAAAQYPGGHAAGSPPPTTP